MLALFGALPTPAGVNVSPRTAMTCTPVHCAVQAIAEAIGQLPVHVYARDDDGAKQRAPDHPAHALLHDQVSEWTSASDFREQLTRDALLHGNGFAYINRVDGKPVELNRLDAPSVAVLVDDVTGEPSYRHTTGTTVSLYSFRDVLHIKAPSLNGVTGESPIQLAHDAIALAIVMERHAEQLFANGARPGGAIEHPKVVGPLGAKRIVESFATRFGGEGRYGIAFLDEGMKFSPVSFSSVDAQFLELRAFAIAEIARAFRVPPILLMDYGRATWSNSEQMGQQFLTWTLLPWIKRWEGEVRLKLIAPDDRATYFAEFLTDDLLRVDLAARADAYATMISARVLNPNEARAAENRPPYDGGDEFLNPNVTVTSTTTGPAST